MAEVDPSISEHEVEVEEEQGQELVEEQVEEQEEFEQELEEELEQELEQEPDQEQGQGQGQEQALKVSIPLEEQRDGDLIALPVEKRWPGWPGECVFRMLVPAQKVGSIIGRKGEFIKKIVEDTRSRVKILDGPPGTSERAVMVSAKEEPESSIPPAIDGLLRVHKRIFDGLEGDNNPSMGGKVSTRFLVAATQAGSLIGKQGGTVKSIQEASNCIVRVLGTEDLPIFALQDDRVVEVVGEPLAVHKAVELIASHLRKFLVDRSVIPLFEIQMQAPNLPPPMEPHMPPPHQSWGPPPQGFPPLNGGAGGFGSNPQFMGPPRQHESYFQPHHEMGLPMDKQPHQGISAYGREPPVGVHATSNPQSASSVITQMTQHMQIPLSYADAVIGTAGASISYIRRASGATVTIQETKGAPGEMTVEINGTASQVQTAQQLVQNFMAEAAAAQSQMGGGGGEQGGYNSYGTAAAAATAPPPSHASLNVYPSPPSNVAHAPGPYGSVYGSTYGY